MADLSKELNKELSKDFAYCEDALCRAENAIGNLPSVQPEKRTETHACDLIDREAAVDAIYHHLPSVSRTRARTMLHEVPSVQPEKRTEERTETHACDLIDRQAAIEIVDRYNKSHMILKGKPMLGAASIVIELEALPSAQPEIVRCKDCKLFGNSEQLPSAQPEPKWIPCRESNGNIHPYSELLHESKGILVTYKTRTGRRYVKQVLCNHGRVEKILLGDIVAWLPLPTPYREDEEE